MRLARHFAFVMAVAQAAAAQTTTRVSVTAEGWQTLEQTPSGGVDMTPDGRFVVFMAGDGRGLPAGVHLWDRQTGMTTLLATATVSFNTSADITHKAAISDDGRIVGFVDAPDVFALDRQAVKITAISKTYGAAGGMRVDVSGDGRFIAFETRSSVGVTSAIGVWDVVAAAPRRFGTSSFLDGQHPRLSADGRYIAYNGGRVYNSFFRGDVYRYDAVTGLSAQVNTTAFGVSANTADADVADISGDGRYVLFRSAAGNLVPGDDASSLDLFLKDMLSGAIDRVNVNSAGARVAIDFTTVPSMSPDARWIVFTSVSPNAVANDTNGLVDVFLYDRSGGTVARINRPVAGPEASGGNSYTGIPSADGRYVAFVSEAHNLVAGDTNLWSDVFVHDRQQTPPCPVALTPSDVSTVSNSGTSGTVTVSAAPGCSWVARSDASWLHLMGTTSGSGNGTLSYTLDAHPGTQTFARTASVVVNDRAAGLRQWGTFLSPAIGLFEAPGAPASNVTGSVALGGWAVDRQGIARVRIMRDAVSGESGQVFIGDAVMVPGARPDVEAAFFYMPYNHSAGWGYLLLTHGLPNQGNGTFRIHAYADDVDGHSTLLGSRTLICTNATASDPFGTIDTPAQGETVSGTIVNFGWALTPQPKMIPTDGSTIDVYVDGVNIGHPAYNNFRSDIAGAFPGYANANGAVGYIVIDTRAYADGLHTISWVVTDNAGVAAGIGSRVFTINNAGTSTGPLF